ncbi:hypothetical protein Moror_4315 [Moniliophthora roreri MCA 2997]|uniref:Uncharacterized protein n=1 Tax=Moniliophthora roreri (strain MCA 2997) TaxID=1381753 RepID=V2WGX0_MONRO|nr:hypothetical protein Moror_4315 [Moniliophthora roreri MCA 2997]
MADSVALLFATNLATIGGHVAEMISIFVYPVIGYFWTRRRRRSPLLDFNIAEESTRSMALVEDTTESIECLAKCIASLMLVLQALESLVADEALPKIFKGRERANKLLEEHDSLQKEISSSTEQLSQSNVAFEDPLVMQTTRRISQRIRLLHLKSEMLFVEIRKVKIIHKGQIGAISFAEDVDIEQGLSNCNPETAVTHHVQAIPTIQEKVFNSHKMEYSLSQPAQEISSSRCSTMSSAASSSDLSDLPTGLDGCWGEDDPEPSRQQHFNLPVLSTAKTRAVRLT